MDSSRRFKRFPRWMPAILAGSLLAACGGTSATGGSGTGGSPAGPPQPSTTIPPFIQWIASSDLAASSATAGAAIRATPPGARVAPRGLAVAEPPAAAAIPFPALTFSPRQPLITSELCRRLDHAPDGAYDVTLQPLTDFATPRLVAGQAYHFFTRLAQTRPVDGLVCAGTSYGIQSCFKVGVCNFGGVGVADDWVFSLDCTNAAAVITAQTLDGDVFLQAGAVPGSCILTATGNALADSGTGTKSISVRKAFEVVASDADAPRIASVHFDGKALEVHVPERIDPVNLAQKYVAGQIPPGFATAAPWFCGDATRHSMPCTTFQVLGPNIADAAWKLTQGNMGGTGVEFFWQMTGSAGTTYGMLVTGQSGQGAIVQSKLVLFTGSESPPSSAPVILSFQADPAVVEPGGNTTLTWKASGASSLRIDRGVGEVTGTSTMVRPAGSTVYTLTATGPGGTTSARASVTLAGPVIGSFTATPSRIAPGGSATLAWNVTGATSVSINQGIGPVTGSSVPVTPSNGKRYILTATNAGGSSTATTELQVDGGTGTLNSLTYSEGTAVYTVGKPIVPNVPSVLGGMPTSFDCGVQEVDPACGRLPSGLNLDPVTGIVSGTPMVATEIRSINVNARNATGSARSSLTITVNPE